MYPKIYINLLYCSLLLVIFFIGGCARYARVVNSYYEPTTMIRNGSGEVYILIQENQQTKLPDVKWVLGKVSNDDKKQIDEIFSPHSAAELLQSAVSQELKKSGYSVILSSSKPNNSTYLVDLTKTEIEIDQVTGTVDLKAKCKISFAIDVYKNGKFIKKIQLEAMSSRIDIRDRDSLASIVLLEALQSVMSKSIPELHELFKH